MGRCRRRGGKVEVVHVVAVGLHGIAIQRNRVKGCFHAAAAFRDVDPRGAARFIPSGVIRAEVPGAGFLAQQGCAQEGLCDQGHAPRFRQLDQIVRVCGSGLRQDIVPEAFQPAEGAGQAFPRLENAHVNGGHEALHFPHDFLGSDARPAQRRRIAAQLFPYPCFIKGLLRRFRRAAPGMFARNPAGGGRQAAVPSAHIHAGRDAARPACHIEAGDAGKAVPVRLDTAETGQYLRHPFRGLMEEVDAQRLQLGVVELHPAPGGGHDAHAFLAERAGVEPDGPAPGHDFIGHAAHIVMRIGLGPQPGRVAAHEILTLAVEEARAVREQAGLSFPCEEPGHVPVFDELHVAQGGACLIGQQTALARAGVEQIGAFPAAGVGGQDHGPGPDQHRRAALTMKARRTGHAIAVPDQAGDFHPAKTLYFQFLQAPVQNFGGVGSAFSIGMVEVVAHLFQTALGHGLQLAVLAMEAVPHPFQIHEAVIGQVQNLFQHVLLAQAVVIVGKLIHQIGCLEFRLLDDHVAAGHAAQSSPVARPLVHHEDVPHMLAGLDGGPCAGEAPADHQNVGFQNVVVLVHILPPSPSYSV